MHSQSHCETRFGTIVSCKALREIRKVSIASFSLDVAGEHRSGGTDKAKIKYRMHGDNTY